MRIDLLRLCSDLPACPRHGNLLGSDKTLGPETPGTGEILTLSGCKFDYDDDWHHRCYDCLLPATLRAVMSSATSTQGSILPSLGMRARARVLTQMQGA